MDCACQRHIDIIKVEHVQDLLRCANVVGRATIKCVERVSKAGLSDDLERHPRKAGGDVDGARTSLDFSQYMVSVLGLT